jgi:hypothetical protein
MRDADFGKLPLDSVKPSPVRCGFLEETVSRAQGALKGIHPGAMGAVDAQHEPVEKAPALAGGAAKQSIIVRGQPDDPAVLGEGGCRCGG